MSTPQLPAKSDTGRNLKNGELLVLLNNRLLTNKISHISHGIIFG